MNKTPLTLNVCGIDTAIDRHAQGAQLVIYGQGAKVAVLNLGLEALVNMAELVNDIDAAGLIAGRSMTPCGDPSKEIDTPVVTTVHLVQELQTVRTSDRG